jgi:hypothetical protein
MFISQNLIYENCALISYVKNDDQLIQSLWVMIEYVKEIPARQIFRPESHQLIATKLKNRTKKLVIKPINNWKNQRLFDAVIEFKNPCSQRPNIQLMVTKLVVF